MKIEISEQELKDALIDKKCIASGSLNNPDPFVGVYFESLIEILKKFEIQS